MLASNVIVNSANSEPTEEPVQFEGIRSTQQIEFMKNRIKKLERQVESLTQKLEDDEKAYRHEVENLKEKVNGRVKENKDKFNLFEGCCNSLQASLADLDIRQLLLENTNVGARHIWKVDKLRDRIASAVSEENRPIQSPPYFTDKFGYKFRMRLYLNGDGTGKNTHVSLFFVLMRSQYDDLLSWPFRCRITFRLLKPTNLDESHTESFLSPPGSKSFSQPTQDMNIASGLPLFLHKNKLQEFIKNDAIYIELTISEPIK